MKRIALTLLILFAAAAAFGQTSATTGALIGAVTDSGGGALPGVTVTVTSPQLQGSRTAVTDARGEYIFPLLPAGAYRAEYALSGIQPQVRQGIVVSAQRQTKIDVRM